MEQTVQDQEEQAMASSAQIAETQIDGLQEELEVLRNKILFALTIYPFLQRSMLHQVVGTSVSRRLWDPILESLIEEGLISKTTLAAKTPLARNQTFKVYHLATRQYIPTEDILIVQADSVNA
jgi:hypothetical protein